MTTVLIRIVLIFVIALALPSPSYAFIWGILGRGAITQGVVGAAERTAIMEAASGSRMVIGKASRSGAGGGDFSWLGRKITKEAIEQAIRSNGGLTQDVGQAQCLVLEFNGKGNYIANYCNASVSIGNFIQQNIYSGQLVRIGCQGCSIQPGQLAYYAPLQIVGPFVAVEFTRGDQLQPLAETNEYQQLQANSGGLEAKALRWTWSQRGATLIAEIQNNSPVSHGLVVGTQSIWGLAKAEIFNQCGGSYGQFPPYDSFSGISKTSDAPTWIPPGGKIVVTFRPNTLSGTFCKLSHAIIDIYVFQPGIENGQPQPIVITIDDR
jgi:hypothetical protein